MPHVIREWGRMGYTDAGGTGSPLLFLHGTGCDSRDWEAVLNVLPAGLRTVRVDFRAHGDSDTPTHAFTLRNLADDVLALVEHLGLRDLILVGHSLGGMVAMDAAPRRADIAGLVLLEGWTSLNAAAEAFAGPRFYGTLDAASIRLIQSKAEATRQRVNPANWQRFWSSVQAFDGLSFLRSARIPVFEVYGAMGRKADSERLLRIPQRPEIRWRWIAEAGHYLPHERPTAVAAVCLEACESAAGDSSPPGQTTW